MVTLLRPQRPSMEPGARTRRIRNPHSSGAQVSMGRLGGTRARKGPKALTRWITWSLLGTRVRPMSTMELRRGEQSALHCSGTRTLQVRNLFNPPRPTPRPLPAKEPEEGPRLLPHSTQSARPLLDSPASPGLALAQQKVPPLLDTPPNPECLPL